VTRRQYVCTYHPARTTAPLPQLMIDEVTLGVGLNCKFFVIGAWSTVSRVWCGIVRMQVKAAGVLTVPDSSFAVILRRA
jgi:hypothetical protein